MDEMRDKPLRLQKTHYLNCVKHRAAGEGRGHTAFWLDNNATFLMAAKRILHEQAGSLQTSHEQPAG